jgi:hypothetical protein
MDISALNWLAIVAATVAPFFVGFVWYNPNVFGKAWMKESGMTEEKAKSGNMGKVFGSAFVMSFILIVNMAMMFGTEIGATDGALYGFLTGFGFVAMGIGVNAMYEQRSFKYIIINGGYWMVSLAISGYVLGAWH